jgi:GNAT superfamily N-acetyltransferase
VTADVRLLSPAQIRQRIPELAEVLVDCVHGGASVSFMEPFSLAEAVGFFAEIAEAAQAGERVLFSASADGKVVGTVQLILRMPPNQPHRAEVAKMLVHRQWRKAGIGMALMHAAERHAVATGKTLITLDTASADAERLYERLGYTSAGVIPHYALLPNGEPCATRFYWKAIGGS